MIEYDAAEQERQLDSLRSDLKRKVLAVLLDVNAKAEGHWRLCAFEGYRTPERQAELVKEGRSLLIHSKHNLRPAQACDLVFRVHRKDSLFAMWSWDEGLPWSYIGRSCQAHVLTWGGFWTRLRDVVHVELP